MDKKPYWEQREKFIGEWPEINEVERERTRRDQKLLDEYLQRKERLRLRDYLVRVVRWNKMGNAQKAFEFKTEVRG